MTRLRRAAREELRRRYMAKAAAEVALADYLLGALQVLGVDPARYVGFDDETGELVLSPEAPEPPPAPPPPDDTGMDPAALLERLDRVVGPSPPVPVN